MDQLISKKPSLDKSSALPTEGITSLNPTPDKIIGVETIDVEFHSSRKGAKTKIDLEQIFSATDEKKSTRSNVKVIAVESMSKVQRNLFGLPKPSKTSASKSSLSKSIIVEDEVRGTKSLPKAPRRSVKFADEVVETTSLKNREVIEVDDGEAQFIKNHQKKYQKPFRVERTEAIETVLANTQEEQKVPARKRSPSVKKKGKSFVVPHPEGKRDLDRSEYISQLLREYTSKVVNKRKPNPNTKISTEPLCIIQKPDPEFQAKSQVLISLLRNHLQEIETLKAHQQSQLSHGILSTTLQTLLGKRKPQTQPSSSNPDPPQAPTPSPQISASGTTDPSSLTPNPSSPAPPRASLPPCLLHLDSPSSLLAAGIRNTGNTDLYKRLLKWTMKNCNQETLKKIEIRLGVRLKKKAREGLESREREERGVLPARVVSAVRQLKSFAERVMSQAERGLLGMAGGEGPGDGVRDGLEDDGGRGVGGLGLLGDVEVSRIVGDGGDDPEES